MSIAAKNMSHDVASLPPDMLSKDGLKVRVALNSSPLPPITEKQFREDREWLETMSREWKKREDGSRQPHTQ